MKLKDKMDPSVDGEFVFTNVDEKKETADKLRLIPNEGFTKDMNADKSYKFSCKQCDKNFNLIEVLSST